MIVVGLLLEEDLLGAYPLKKNSQDSCALCARGNEVGIHVLFGVYGDLPDQSIHTFLSTLRLPQLPSPALHFALVFQLVQSSVFQGLFGDPMIKALEFLGYFYL